MKQMKNRVCWRKRARVKNGDRMNWRYTRCRQAIQDQKKEEINMAMIMNDRCSCF